VSSTHALRGRLSSRSENSICDWLGRVGATSSLGLGCEGCLVFAGLSVIVPGACLGLAVTVGADFAVLPFFLLVVTAFRVWLSVTAGSVAGAGGGGLQP